MHAFLWFSFDWLEVIYTRRGLDLVMAWAPIISLKKIPGFFFHPFLSEDSNTPVIVLLFSHSVMSDSATPWTAAHQASLFVTISQFMLVQFMFIESVMPSNHLNLCRPLLLPSIVPSIRVFSSESALLIT